MHRARLRDGTDVAVKVRRPRIVAQDDGDLRLLRRSLRLMQWLLPGLRRQQPLQLLDELATQLRAEIDLKHEAANLAWGGGERFRLPRHLLVLLRTLFLAENTIRALDPDFDLLAALEQRREAFEKPFSSDSQPGRQRLLTQNVVRTTQAWPGLLADLLRQAQSEDGRPSVAVHHRGVEELELSFGRTTKRLSLALVTLGLYIAGSLLMLHSAGPHAWGVPVFALVAYAIGLLLSLRLVLAIRRSGRL